MTLVLRGVLGVCLFAGGVSAAYGQAAPACGLQRAQVAEARDPEGRDRLLITAPGLGSQTIWAERVYAKKPLRAPAAVTGDLVFVLFEGCDPARPVIIGSARP